MSEDHTDYLSAADWGRAFTVVPEWGTESPDGLMEADVRMTFETYGWGSVPLTPAEAEFCRAAVLPPLPGRLARAINVGGGGEVER